MVLAGRQFSQMQNRPLNRPPRINPQAFIQRIVDVRLAVFESFVRFQKHTDSMAQPVPENLRGRSPHRGGGHKNLLFPNEFNHSNADFVQICENLRNLG